jgi:RNA-directed DNA polymerase
MNRAGNLWLKICDRDALRAAHKAARSGKLHYREVRWVDANEDAAIEAIYQSLVNKTYTTSPYEVEERFDGRKLRTIHKLPYYPDRIVQHALVSACEDVWCASFIRDTFQSIVGRGTHDARKRVRAAVRGNSDLYALKFDVKKYYPSVDSALMKEKVRKTIKCKDTLWLLDDIIDSCKGLPIGNYTSQYLGNVYLNDFDWWVKQLLQPRGYFRYCDDIVVLGNSAEECHAHREVMFGKLSCEYHLSVKKDWQVFPVDVRGLDFVGFVFTSRNVKLRKGIANGVRNKARKIKRGGLGPYQIAGGAGSYWGWCKHGQGRALWAKHMTSDALYTIKSAKALIKEQQTCK